MRDFRHQAELADRDREDLSRVGILPMARVGQALARTVVGATKDGAGESTVRELILAGTAPMAPILRDLMVAGHLRGRLRAMARASATLAASRLAFGAYDEAIEQFRKRLVLTDEDIERLRKLYNNEAVRVTRSTNDVLEAKATAAIKESLALGEHTKDAAARMRAAFAAAGVVPDNNFLCETLARTQIQLAYGAGAWNANQAPEIQEILHGYHYVTVGDNRVRPNHAAMDGTKAGKDDQIWSEWWPPCGFNCRCSAIPIFEDFDENIPDPMPEPDEGWDYNPGQVFRDHLNDELPFANFNPAEPRNEIGEWTDEPGFSPYEKGRHIVHDRPRTEILPSDAMILHHGGSAETVEQIRDIWKRIPPNIQTLLTARGARFQVGKTGWDIDPRLMSQHPRGWAEGQTWEQAEAWDGDNQVSFVEQVKYEASSTSWWSGRPAERVVPHEVGHLVDESLGWPSRGNGLAGQQFRKIWAEECRKFDNAGGSKELQYESWHNSAGSDAGASEAFATAYSIAMHDTDLFDRVNGRMFRKHFAKTIDFVRQHVINYRMEAKA